MNTNNNQHIKDTVRTAWLHRMVQCGPTLFIICYLLFLISPQGVQAQPKKSRVASSSTTTTSKKKASATPGSDRAALMFPTTDEMPEDVVWRRDIYRQLDLMEDANAPLYYPVEPRGKEQNLFTYLFRLFVSGRIPVYTYKLDGNESFEDKDKADAHELLDRYSIYYEEKDGKVSVPESDIPSAEVTRMYIKESSYFDQRSATYRSRVTALCPVLMRGADDFGTEATPYPLFWVKYDDVASYLSRMPIMASNLNNVTNMTVDDYFTMNRYKGKIYKTNNLQGRILANDSTRTREQERIEQQLKDFEEHIWHQPEQKDSLDSVAVAPLTGKAAKSKAKAEKAAAKKEKSSSRRSSSSAAASKKSGGSSAPRVSARRQRR